MRMGNQEMIAAYLQPRQLAALRTLSRKTGTPVAALIRAAIDHYLWRDHDHQAEASTPKQARQV
jgi:predicted DNA-binding protein